MRLKLNRSFIMSISYGNYLQSVGGVDKCILEQQRIANNKGYSYVFFFDISHYIRKKNIYRWGCIIDGKYQGICTTEDIIKIAQLDKLITAIIIHHFQYIELNDIDKILYKTKIRPYIYIHDYFTCCAEGHFLKTKNTLCDTTENYDERCINCQYREKTHNIRSRFKNLFKKYEMIFVCPSDTVMELFLLSYPEMEGKIIVVPHEKLCGKIKTSNDYNRIAFIGMPHYMKGYETWKKVIAKVSHDKYRFYQFGRETEKINDVEYHNVKYGKTKSMTDFLLECKIGIVLLWSICPETYSYTLFEAIGAGAFIVTNCNSGNIAREVEKQNCGVVLNNEDELIRLLNSSCLNRVVKEKAYDAPKYIEPNDDIFSFFDKANIFEEYTIKIKRNIMSTIISIVYWGYRLIYRLIR